ncbi:MAG: chemotaxis protein CheW [Campylobacterales bacterium]|nr:chemotaxis protein CheW [Campylobacterales bacterium]
MSQDLTISDEKKALLADTDRFLTLFIDDEQYGLDIDIVKEIIAMMNTTPVPKTPDYLQGVMNLRGNIIPVVNLRKKFGMVYKETDDRTAIVIVSIEGTNIGFIVDRVEEVLAVEKTQFSKTPNFDTAIDSEFISKMVRTEEGVVMILDLKKAFDQDELAFFESLDEEDDDE